MKKTFASAQAHPNERRQILPPNTRTTPDPAKSFGLGRIARVRYVVWPTVLPYLMTGVRLASAVALILAITAELVIGSPGLGKQIGLTQSGGAVAEMYALIV